MAKYHVDRDVNYMYQMWGTTSLITDYWTKPRKTEDPEETTKKILSPVTLEEIEMMHKFGLENGDGEVDKAEYIILCMVRIGAVTPPLVEEIITRFKSLDHSNDGALSYAELMQEHDKDGNVIHK